MDIEDIKRELGDCDWMRAVLNDYTVEAILWLIREVDKTQVCPECGYNWKED